MAWLIEAYETLNEAPVDDANKVGERVARKLYNAGKITDKDAEGVRDGKFGATAKTAYLGAKETAKAYKDKDVKNALEHKYGKTSKIQDIKDTVKAAKGDQKTIDDAYKKYTDAMYAKDAKDRHERRHPELKKATNESADLIEILQ